MTSRPHDLSEWLAEEEAGGAWDDADAKFAAVAAVWLPMAEVPAGLSGRIMAAIPRAADSRWARVLGGLLASWWVRGTVGVAMLVLGAAAAVVTIGQIFTVGAVVTVVIAAGHGALAAASAALHGGVAAWTVAVSLGQAAATVTATRTSSLIMLANLALAAGAFAGLTRLLPAREEEC
jgi:hypothetical protein